LWAKVKGLRISESDTVGGGVPLLRIQENIFQNHGNFNVSLTYPLKGFSYIWNVIKNKSK
jgi:hypothetical protein